ncbi:MAG: low temperature requirement protein A [Actinobacteria bacterium]|nr:low temperature requirement protein A [Actinomycetota bacterium]
MEGTTAQEERVTPLELFFDLVFVFGITQVTTLLSDDPTWGGLARGLLVLSALWWAWAAYAWLTNTLNPEEGAVRLAVFAIMGAMLIAALAVPEAFGDHGVLFGVSYFVVRALHLALYALAAKGDHDLLGAVLRMVPSSTISGVLIVTAGFLGDAPQIALWVIALSVDYLGVAVGGGQGWRVSPGHFAERHGLIIIIAIGECIVAVGLGAAGVPLGPGVVTAALFATAIAAVLWWAYFDVVAIVAERKLTEAKGAARAAQARDSYSYLHLPMVAGIVLFAFAMKKTLADVDEPLKAVPAAALCGGLALYFLAHVAFRLRNVRTWNKQRVLAALALLALYPAVREVPALAAVAGVTAVTVGLIAYEAIRFREARTRVRQARQPA